MIVDSREKLNREQDEGKEKIREMIRIRELAIYAK